MIQSLRYELNLDLSMAIESSIISSAAHHQSILDLLHNTDALFIVSVI